MNTTTLSEVLKLHSTVAISGGNGMKYTCPCCGFCTLDEKPPGTYDICEICFWEDDNVQYYDPDYEGGANKVSLRQGQRNYMEFGVCEERCLEFVRKPSDVDRFIGPKDISMIQRMPIKELINLFMAINAPLEKILDIYKGQIEIKNTNYVFNSSQLRAYISLEDSTEYSMLSMRDNPNVYFGEHEIYNLTSEEVKTKLNRIRTTFIEAIKAKHT